jgi:hypothetical protein
MTRPNLPDLLAEAGRWERWTIDEVADERVRLLICEAREGVASEGAELLAELAPGAEPDGEAVTQRAMAVELAPTRDRWTDEAAVVVDEAATSAFLRRRMSRGVLPGPRPLREGDVFWVFVPAGAPRPEALDPAALPAAYDDAGSAVLDLTPAARQAVKLAYRQADRAAGPPEPGAR